MGISNPLKGLRKGGTVGNPLPGVQVGQINSAISLVPNLLNVLAGVAVELV